MMKMRKKSGLRRGGGVDRGGGGRRKGRGGGGWKRAQEGGPQVGGRKPKETNNARRESGGGRFCGGSRAAREAERGAQIEKWRLFKQRFSIRTRSDPIAGLRHVARDPGVARLVRADETDGPEMAEVAYAQSRHDEQSPADAGGGPDERNFGDGSGRFGHGKLSLTSNHYLQALDVLHTVARQYARRPMLEDSGSMLDSAFRPNRPLP